MTNIKWFILAFIVIAGLGYWNWKKSGEQVKALQASGFSITDDLKGAPKLLVDSSRQQIAVVYASEYYLYDFQQIKAAHYLYDSNRATETNYRIELSIQASKTVKEVIAYADEWSAKEQYQRLQALIN